MRLDRDRIMNEFLFWLRPDFLMRCLRRFQALEGFDRAIALASSAFTAMIPLTILVVAVIPGSEGSQAADSVIRRYDLSAEGAQAVRDAFAPAEGVDTGIGVLGAFLLMFALLAFARAVQRLVERAWELRPLSLRNTRNAVVWILGLATYGALATWVNSAGDERAPHVLGLAVSAVLLAGFIVWTGRLLGAHRVSVRDLLPFAILVGAGLVTYGVVSDIYIPRLFNTYVGRYGVIGATFAIISALFGAMFVVVVMTAIGREVSDELARVRRGERPPPDAMRREWDAILADLRARRDVWLEGRRRRDEVDGDEVVDDAGSAAP